MLKKYVYDFKEGNERMVELLGIKGARLSELTNLNLPVPKGFIVTTGACKHYYKSGKNITLDIEKEILINITNLENIVGKGFGQTKNSLLLSVRSSTPMKMPGVNHVVLNVGINDEISHNIACETGSERFATELYINFIISFMYATLPNEGHSRFEQINRELIRSYLEDGYRNITIQAMKKFISRSKKLYLETTGKEFPDDPKMQLVKAIVAIFDSWRNKRAEVYRRLNNIDNTPNVGVVIQEMVFGNLDRNSAVGHIYSRNNKTGEDIIWPKFFVKTQNDEGFYYDPECNYIEELNKVSLSCLEKIKNISKVIEKHYKDMQYIDLVIESGNPYVLMSQNGKREAEAALNIAVDLVNEGLITEEQAVSRVSEVQLREIKLPVFLKEELTNAKEIAQGLSASKGVVCGRACFTLEEVRKHKLLGEKVILITFGIRTYEENKELFQLIDGVLTNGGMCSDMAILSRQNWKPCVALNSKLIEIDRYERSCIVNGVLISEGDYISIDGKSGKVFKGKIDIIEREKVGSYGTFMKWMG